MNLIWIEVIWWYDWIAYRVDDQWKRLSRVAKKPIDNDELCRYGKICKVEQIGKYDYKVISQRDDK